MRNRVRLFLLLTILTVISVFAFAQTRNKNQNNSDKPVQQSEQSSEHSNYKPEEGYVPDEETAIAIAVAVWNPIYGKEKIESEKPFRANLKDGVWTVSGSLPKGYDKGGTAIAEISKDDGQILRITHGK